MTETVKLEKKRLDKIKILSGAQLKYIAFLSMLIDHTNKALIYPILNEGILQHISNLFDIIGRIAFPLFAFFVVEGFFKTKNRKKYLTNLFVFAVISEVPFDMFLTSTFFNTRANNVLFTLALSLITIWIIDILKNKLENKPPTLWYLVSVVVIIISCFISMQFGLDYEHHSIIIVYLFYIFYNKPVVGCALAYLSIIAEVWSILGFGLVLTYNGERGKQNKIINYWFYPVHLLILGILRMYFGI